MPERMKVAAPSGPVEDRSPAAQLAAVRQESFAYVYAPIQTIKALRDEAGRELADPSRSEAEFKTLGLATSRLQNCAVAPEKMHSRESEDSDGQLWRPPGFTQRLSERVPCGLPSDMT